MDKTFLISQLKNTYDNYDNIQKVAIGQGDNYTTDCLQDYLYFKQHYKMIAIDLSKQQALDADPKAIQQISFTWSLARNRNTKIFFIIEETK